LVIFSHLPMRQAYLDMSDAAETMSRARSQARAERQERDVVPFIPGEQTTTQPRTVKTCAFCEPMCATTERQLADRLKRMRQIPDVPVLPCSKCGSTDWATTDKFVVRRDEPQQSASEDARATPPAEPSS